MLCEIALRIPIWRRHPGDEVEWRVNVCHALFDLDCKQLIAQITFVYCRIEYELDRSNRHAILIQTRPKAG